MNMPIDTSALGENYAQVYQRFQHGSYPTSTSAVSSPRAWRKPDSALFDCPPPSRTIA